MPRDFLHNHPQFADLIRIVADEKGIDPALAEKDYWIMHCLYGLQQLSYTFQLKAAHRYDPRYTFVEKLQTISTKFRKQQADGSDSVEFMRHYYDVYELLKQPDVQNFIGTDAYKAHNKRAFAHRRRRARSMPGKARAADVWCLPACQAPSR
ncbi:hypothetical protein ABH994_005534 [Bradyrhizobium yuanmingense]|uniref:nucleotidyl transferase AbiEii/AbiGii toxin family protein n=1 Tax=Bradyrhizobium yuanmingense TaxID=108015 RepID=UPI0035117D0E